MSLFIEKDIVGHAVNISNLILNQGKVISASDDGIVKVWSTNLDLLGEMQNPGGILSISAIDNILYTVCSDDSIQSWDLNNFQSLGTIKSTLNTPQKLYADQKNRKLWVGDANGVVAEFRDGEEYGRFELVEEVWDLMVSSDPTCIYTARDRDIVIAEILTGKKSCAMIRKTISGRSPMCIAGKKLIFVDRDGRVINVHGNSLEDKFPKISEFVGSEVIINALVSAGSGNVIYSGGYDNTVKQWNIVTKECTGSVNVDSVVNALCSPSEDEVIAALSNGKLIKAVKK